MLLSRTQFRWHPSPPATNSGTPTSSGDDGASSTVGFFPCLISLRSWCSPHLFPNSTAAAGRLTLVPATSTARATATHPSFPTLLCSLPFRNRQRRPDNNPTAGYSPPSTPSMPAAPTSSHGEAAEIPGSVGGSGGSSENHLRSWSRLSPTSALLIVDEGSGR